MTSQQKKDDEFIRRITVRFQKDLLSQLKFEYKDDQHQMQLMFTKTLLNCIVSSINNCSPDEENAIKNLHHIIIMLTDYNTKKLLNSSSGGIN